MSKVQSNPSQFPIAYDKTGEARREKQKKQESVS
jgi:hypothetical protein